MGHGERQFASDVAAHIDRQLRDLLRAENLTVETDVRILSDMTCATDCDPNGRYLDLRLSCLEQDIVIGYRVDVPSAIRPYLTNLRDKSALMIPRIVIEAKYADVNSHTVMTYSEIAGRLKGVYQGLYYYLLIRGGGKTPGTLERHGRMFDRMYHLEHTRNIGGRSTLARYEEGDWPSLMRKGCIRRGMKQLLKDIRQDLVTPRVWTGDQPR